MKSSENEGHHHIVEIDSKGNGRAIETSGNYKRHEHAIVDFRIQPAEGHDHHIKYKCLINKAKRRLSMMEEDLGRARQALI